MVETLRSIQLWTAVLVLVMAPLFFGSVDLFWVAVWALLLSLSALCGIALPLGPGQYWILLVFLALCGIYAGVAVIQLVPNAIVPLNDPNWARANDLLGLNALPRISSRAEIPPLAVGHFVLFASSFINGFLIATSARNSSRLVLCAQWSILLYAIYGLAALELTPDMILWAPKLAYRGSLTATFVNHNTAATFVGAGAILWSCYTMSSIQSFRFSSIRLLLLSKSNEHRAFQILARSGGALACFFALLLTGSRGGLICSCLGLLVGVLLMAAWRRQLGSLRFLALTAATLAFTIAVLGQMGRIGSHGLFDDARWSIYGFCLEAIRQRPWLGAGVGTFADVLPSLRADDFYSWGVWDYAHSTILEMAVEMGVPVAALAVLASLASLFLLVRAALRSEGRSRRTLAAITGMAVLSYLHSTIDFSLQIPGYLILFGMMLGCGLARAAATGVTLP